MKYELINISNINICRPALLFEMLHSVFNDDSKTLYVTHKTNAKREQPSHLQDNEKSIM